MPSRDDNCAVLIDGGPGGLAAAWAASACQSSGAGQPAILICIPPGPTSQRRQKAAERLVEVCGVKKAIQLQLPERPSPLLINDPSTDPDARRVVSHLLLDACIQAMKLDLPRLIWPVHSGAPTEAELRTEPIADACDRSLLVGQIASLDAPRTGPGSRGVRIETPYADFTDLQLAELIIDLGAPLAASAWCEQPGERTCAGSCSACRRWSQAFKRVGSRIPVGR